MKWILRIVKAWPIITNLSILLILIFHILEVSISNLMYPIFGHSLFVDILFLMMSYKLKFCFWHKLLILNLIAIIGIEWISVNLCIIDSVFYIRLLFTLTSVTLLTSTVLYSKYGMFKKHT